MIPIPYEVWGTIRVIYDMKTLHMWGTICTCGGPYDSCAIYGKGEP